MATRKYICPSCRQKTGVDILYGFPTKDAASMAEQNEIALGGCCIHIGQSPERKCTSCEHEWRIVRRKPYLDYFSE